MERNQKLELTWVGKEKRARLEPRVLVEKPELSHHAATRRRDGKDIFDNMLIHGDNLLALKALEQQYAGRIRCVLMDPPFNTGAAFEYYDDGVEHSIWLGLMRERFEVIKRLLTSDGVLFVILDDSESSYCKVLLDEIFGRDSYVNEIINITNKAFGFKSTSTGIFKQANHILFYANDKSRLHLNSDALFIEKGYDPQYKFVFDNIDKSEEHWTWRRIADVIAEQEGCSTVRDAKKKLGDDEFELRVSTYAIDNASRVFRTASVSGGAFLKRKETIARSKRTKDKIVRHPNDDMDYMFIGGERVLFYKERLRNIDGMMLPGDLITDVWTDIPVEGLASEGGVDFPKGKKPEKLIERCLAIATNPGDLVLDSFLGSGTTAAVAHKMGRRWIGVELGDHCYTHCKVRLDKVIDGEDAGGITKTVGWKGGGGYRFYELAPTLITKDQWGQEVINRDYNPAMLAEAVCKLEGYIYAPSQEEYFIHGHATEKAFIYVTTNYMRKKNLAAISERLGAGCQLLICCKAFDKASAEDFDNLTVKKIPDAVLKKCEWGHDDYSLNVKNLPMAEEEQHVVQDDLF